MNEKDIIEVRDFTKVYGKTIAVERTSFSVREGQILAILGPNGAGKTSSLECIEGVRRPDGGSVRVFGLDPARETRKLSRLVGIQLQAQGLPGSMTVRESLGFFARYRGAKPDYTCAERIGLGPKFNSAVSELSTGLQRRLALAIAVSHGPRLLVLDEPTAGLDVESRDELHSLMTELKGQGTTILLATHDMAETEKLADHAIVMVRGKIVARGTPRELTAGGTGRTRIVISTEASSLLKGSAEFPGVERQPDEDSYAVFLSDRPAHGLKTILAWIEAAGDEVIDLRVERPTLEERFLEIVQRRTA